MSFNASHAVEATTVNCGVDKEICIYDLLRAETSPLTPLLFRLFSGRSMSAPLEFTALR